MYVSIRVAAEGIPEKLQLQYTNVDIRKPTDATREILPVYLDNLLGYTDVSVRAQVTSQEIPRWLKPLHLA